MRAVLPPAAASRAVDGSTLPSTGECGGSPTEAVAGTRGLNASCRAATSAALSSILHLQRQYPASFAAVGAAASSAGQLQILQDPLWLAVMGTVHMWQRSTHAEAPSDVETANLSSAAAEGGRVAAAIREAARVAEEGDPLLRLEAAALLGEAAALLHSIGNALAASSREESAVVHGSTISGSEHSQCLAAAAENAANAMKLLHLRLLALPISVSIVSLGSRGGAPWKPRPCSALSGVAATPLLQLPAAADELLLLDQQICLTLRFLDSLDACGLEIQPLHVRCMQALQQVQQLALQLALPSRAARAGHATTAETAVETALETAAEAAKAVAADDEAAAQYHYTCGGAALPPAISSPPGQNDREMNWQHWLRSRGALTAPGSNKAWSTGANVQRRQQELLHSWPKPLAIPLSHLMRSLRYLGKRHTAQQVLPSRGCFFPTASMHWRSEFMGCATNVAAGPAVESSFLLKHATKLHALLTSSLRPELALR